MATLASASTPILKTLKTYSTTFLISVIIFTSLASASLAGPRGTSVIPKCASFCAESSKFQYETTSTYIYDYSTDVSTYVVHGSSGESRVHLTAKVELTPLSQCDFQLKLKDVSLQESDLQNPTLRTQLKDAGALARELEKIPLQFSYQNGKIESICSDEEDSLWTLNVKRGILSMLQNTMDKGQPLSQTVQEVDVNGKCSATYTLEGTQDDGKSQTVTRTKNLKGCNHRHSHITGIQSIPYTSSSPIQSLPLLAGTQTCTQIIQNSKIIRADCAEEHNFQPFDYIQSGARTKVVQTLTLLGEQAPSLTVDGGERKIRKSSLLFESEDSQLPRGSNIDVILQRMQNLEEKNATKIRANAPEHFMEIIGQLRSLDTSSLNSLHSKATTIGKIFLLDALPFVGTSHALAFIRDLFLEAKLTAEHKDAWLTSLAFIKKPSIEMINVLEPLLTVDPESQVLFGISSMVHSYCREHEDCASNPVIVRGMRKIYALLHTCDVQNEGVNSKPFLRTIYALKSIGNAGRLVKLQANDDSDQSSQHLIEKCFRINSNPIEIRLAAVDAFRRMTCNSYNHHALLQLLKNTDENTEIRIQAYLTLMRCPNNELIQSLKEVFYTDTVNQVVSFMWTHLTNLQETSSPDKQSIRELLSNEELKNKLNSDVRKFSRNYEGAKYWEKYNVGAGYDANLIFSPESFVPRSGMVNITTHLFGESINLLEFGIRMHSMEQLLEPIFGPAGYFPDQTVNQALHSMRVRRNAVSNQIDRLGSIYTEVGDELDAVQPGGSFYTRIFGNEITSKSFVIAHKDRTVPTMVDENGKNWFDLTYWLDNMSKGKSMEYTKSNVIMDLSYTVPTSAGLPLTLNIQSASTVGISASGKVDLHKYWDNKELEIVGKLSPSAAIQLVGTMSIGVGHEVQSGLRIENTLHSSTAVEGKAMLKHGKLVHASFGLPQAKQELFQAKSQMYIVKPSGEKVEEKGPANFPKIAHNICTPNTLETILGIRICGEINIPESLSSSFFKVPTSLSLHVEKTDNFSSYDFSYKWERKPNKTDIELIFDTPGSQIRRRVAANYIYDVTNGLFVMGIDTPSKSLAIDGELSQNASHFQLTAKSGTERVFFLDAALKKQLHRIEPHFAIYYKSKPLVEIDGTAVGLAKYLRGEGKATFDINVKHLTDKRINLNGELSRNEDMYDHALNIDSHLLTTHLKSHLRVNDNLLLSKVEAEYSINGGTTVSYNINGKIQKSRKGVLTKYYAIYNFTPAASPDSNIALTWELHSGGRYCENLLKVVYGTETWTGKTVYSNQISKNHKDLRLELLLHAPKRGFDYNFVVSHQGAENGFSSKCLVRFDPQNEFNANAQYLEGSSWQFKRNLSAAVKLNEWIDYSLRATVDETKPREYEVELSMNNAQNEMKATATYKDHSSNTRVDHSLNFEARGPATWPAVTGTAILIASEKLGQIGGQLSVGEDGVPEPDAVHPLRAYMGKWSGSLTYTAAKKHTRKVEGKLALKDKKYHSTIILKRTRNGDRTFVMDLNYGRRFLMEAQMSGSWPTPTTVFVSIFPNKNRNPEYKLSCQSTIDAKSMNVRLDYFGQLAEFAGSYENGRGQVEIQWIGNRQFLLSFDMSKLGWRETIFMIDLQVPSVIENFGFSLQHSLSASHLSTQISGNLNDDKSTVSINGAMDTPESQLSIIVDMSQWRKFQAQLRMLKTHNQLVLDFNNQLGDDTSRLRLEHARNHQGVTCKAEFDGCSFVPKMRASYLSQMSSKQFTDIDIEWISLEDGTQKKVNVKLEGEEAPWNYNLHVNTPWSPLDMVEVALRTEFDSKFLVGLSVTGNHELFPLELKLDSDGSLFHSNNEVVFSWTDNGKQQFIKLVAENEIDSWTMARHKSSIEFIDHTYKLALSSNKGKHLQEIEVSAMYDELEFNGGFAWQCENRGNRVKVSAWTEYPDQPKIKFDYLHLNDENYFILDSHVQEADRTLGQIVTEFHYTGFEHWEVTAKLNSVLNLVPTISFTSKHSIEDLNEIRHSTEFVLTETSKLWGGLEDTKVLLEFNLKNGRDLSGWVQVNEKEIKLIGLLESESDEEEERHAQKVDLEISSELFDSIHAMAEYKVDSDSLVIGFSGSKNGTTFVSFNLGGAYDSLKHSINGNLNLLCPFGHQLEGSANIDMDKYSVKIALAETKQNALGFALAGKMHFTDGHLNMALTSKLFEPYNIELNTDYRFENDKFQLNGIYKYGLTTKSLTSVFIWKPHLKKFQLVLKKPDKYEMTAELSGPQFQSYISHDDKNIVSFEGKYSWQPTEASSMIKHILELEYKQRDRESCKVVAIAGLDVNHVMLNVQTPFEGWQDWTLDAQISHLSERWTKAVDLSLKNNKLESHKYLAHIEIGNHKLAFTCQSPIEGFSNFEAELHWDLRRNMEIGLQGTWETKRISLETQLTNLAAEFKLQTPWELFESVRASAEWNLKNPIKTFETFVQWNQETHQVSGEWQLEFMHGHANLVVDTPILGKYKTWMKYSFISDAQFEGAYENGNGKSYLFSSKLELSSDNEVALLIATPFSGYRNITLQLKYLTSDDGKAYSGVFEWNIDGLKQHVSAELSFKEPGKVEVVFKSPVHHWSEMTATLFYKLEKNKKLIELHLEKEGAKCFEIKNELNFGGDLIDFNKNAKVSIGVSVQTVLLPGYENVDLLAEYKRTARSNQQSLSLVTRRNDNVIVDGKLNFQFNNAMDEFSVDLNGDISAPVFGLPQTTMNGTFTSRYSRNEKLLQLLVKQNEMEQLVKASHQWTSTVYKLDLVTPLKALKHLQVDLHSEHDGRIGGVLELNNKRVDMDGQLLWNGFKNFKLTYGIKTPFTHFKTVHAQISSNVQSDSLRIEYILQNDNVRYMGNVEGSRNEDSGQLKIQLNNPISKLEQLLTAVHYNSSGVFVRVERNTQEEIFGLLSYSDDKLELSVNSKLSNFPIDGKAKIDFGNRAVTPNIDIYLNANLVAPHTLQLHTQMNGYGMGEVSITTSMAQWNNVHLKWQVDGSVTGGQAKLEWNLPSLGHAKSVRTSWKLESYSGVQLEFWLSSPKEFDHEKGFSVQYNLSSQDRSSGKFGGTITYVLDKKEQQVTVSTALKKSANTNSMEFTLQTPFELLKHFTLTSRLVSSPEVTLDLSATHNHLKIFTSNVVTFISPMASKLKFSLNAPLISEEFNLNAGYDLTKTEKTLEIAFSQNKYQLNVKTQAIVPENPEEIELRIMVESNVPSVEVSASGSLRAGYKVQADETRQIIVAINSEQTGLWKITAGIRPIASNFNIKFKMDTPAPKGIPSVQSELKLTGSMAKGVDAELYVQIGTQQPTHATLSFGQQMVRANFKSGIFGLEDLGFDGIVESQKQDTLNHRFHFGIRSGKESCRFEGDIQAPVEGHFAKGSIKLTSTWGVIPNASLGVNVATNGTVIISGMWGPRKVNIRGNLHKNNGSWKSVTADISLSVNAEEIFHVQSKHLLNEREQSLNLTIGDNYKLETYYRTDSKLNIFSSTIQWSPSKQVHLIAETGLGQFNASIKTPWTSEIHTHGEYKVTSHEYSGKATCIVDGQESHVEANVLTSENSFNSHLGVNIPWLNQKLEVKAKIARPDEHFIEGDLDMQMKDRRVGVKGSLTSNVHKHADNVAMDEKLLKLSVKLPFKRYSEMNGELSLKKPVDSMSRVQIESTITVGLKTGKGQFHYQLPLDGSKAFSIGLMADIPFISTEKYEWLIDISDVDPLHFNGDIQYKTSHIYINWNLEDDFNAKIFANMPIMLPELSPINLEAKGLFKDPNDMHFRSTLTWKTRSVTLQASLLNETDSLSGRVFVHAPFIMAESSEVTVKLQKFETSESRRRVVELTANYGKESISSTGEFILSRNNMISTSLKLSGYYGAHFIQLSSTKKNNNAPNYEVELNAESVTLLKGKKMSLIGKIEFENKGFSSTLECRTRQSTHVISTNVNWNPQHGVFSIRLESPYVKAINFDGEYLIERNPSSTFHAKLSANIMSKSHVLKVGYDLVHPEAYFLLSSPILASKVFNIHLKSKLGEHVDMLADFNIFGHEWKLETKGIYVPNEQVETKLEIRTPFESLRRVTLGVTLSPKLIHFEFYTPIEDLPNFVISLANVPLFGKPDFKNFNPQILIGLPWMTYSASGLILLPTKAKAGEISFMVGYGDPRNNAAMKEFKFGIQVSPIEEMNYAMDEPVHVTLAISTPYKHFRSFECGFGGRINLRSWSEINVNLEVNGREVGFTSEVQRDEATKRFILTLTTPFENLERTSLSFRLETYQEIGTGTNFQLDFEQSSLMSPIHTEIDYHYRVGENPFNMDGEVTIHLPDAKLPPIFLRVQSSLLQSGYDGVLEGHWGQWKPSFKLNGGFSHAHTFGAVEAKFEDTPYQALARFDFRQHAHEISVLAETQISNRQILVANIEFVQTTDIVKCNIFLKSPQIADFSSLGAELRISPLSKADSVTLEKLLHSLDVSFGITFNQRKVFQFELVSKNNQRSLEIHNPIQPISFVVSYQIQRNQKLQLTTAFCWNLLKPERSTVGARFNYARYPHGGDVLLKLQGGEFGTLVVDTSHVWSAVKLEQTLKLDWASIKLQQNTSFGYYVLYSDETISDPANRHTQNLVLRVDLPWRSVQTDYSTVIAKTHTKVSTTTHAELKWDVAVDPTRRIGYLSTLDSTKVKRSTVHKSTFTLLHSGQAQNNIAFETEKTFKNNKLHETEYIFKPNQNPQNQLTIRLSHENITDKGLQIMITHPSTNVDINSILSLSDASSLFHLAYLDIRGERHVIHLQMTKSNHHRNFELSFGPDANSLSSVAKLETEFKPQDLEHVISLNTPFLQLDTQIRTGLPYLNAVVRHGADESMTVSIGLNHKRRIVMQILRNEFGQNIQDLFVVAKFNNSDTVSTGVHWRPEMFQEFNQFISVALPRFVSESVDGVIPAALERINEEVEERLKVIDPALDRLYVSLSRFVGSEFKSAINELGELQTFIETKYDENKFYVKDMVSFTGDVIETAYESSSNALLRVQNLPFQVTKYLSDTYNDLRALSQLYSGNLETVVMNAWKSTEKVIANAWKAFTKKINSYLAKGKGVYDTVMAAVEGNWDLLETKVYGVELFRKIACLYEDYNSWLQELPIQGYLNQLKELFQEHVLDPLEIYYKPYFVVANQIIEDGNLYALLEMPPVPYFRYIATSFMDSSSRLWKFIEAEERIRDLVGEILGRVNNLIQRHIPLGKISYEMEKGHFEFHQPLTFIEWEDFTHMPKWRVPENDAEDISRINELYYTLLDTLRVSEPFTDLDFRKMLPPFGANAIMAGDHHYLTFDKKYFRFAGDCNSYVLMADRAHQNFTLLVNYESNGIGGMRKKSYSLVSGQHVIEFDIATFKVTLDGRKTELPLEVGPTFIRRQANGLEIFDSRGFQMQCNLSPSVCSVSVSGWYFAKLAGLLGTYDNEPNNDFKRPDGRIVYDAAAFAYSWRVGSNSGQCRPRNYARELPEYQDLDGICKEYLVDLNSPFRPCFNEVPPEPFMEMCKYDVTANRNSVYRPESTCAAINAYVTECQKNKVDLWSPTHCVKCKLEDGSTILGYENATLQEGSYISPVQAADVVVIVEETPLLKNYSLNDVILKLEFALRREGLQNNRYTLVGFGGKGPYKTPHIRTTAGQVWSTSTLFKIPDSFPMDGERNGNFYEAIEFGSGIGFRAGVAKVMVAVIVDDESSKGVHRGYADTYTLLIENDIRLHILSPKDITLKTNKRDDGNKVFGLDRDGVFTLWQSKRGATQSDKTLRRYINLPKDYYTPLAFESSGTRFNMKYMKTYLYKTFLDVWSRLVAKSAKTADCQHCECIPDKAGGAVTICQPCISPTFKEFLENWKDIRSSSTQLEPAGVAPADSFDFDNSEQNY